MRGRQGFRFLSILFVLIAVTMTPERVAAYKYVTSGSSNYFPALIRLSPRVSTSWSQYANGDAHQDSRLGVELGITPLNLVAAPISCEISISLDPYVMTSTTPGYTGFYIPGYTIQLAPAFQLFPGEGNILGLVGILGVVRREDFPAQPTIYTGDSKLLEYFSGGGGLAFTRFMGENGDKGVLSARILYTRLLFVNKTSDKVITFQENGSGLTTLQEIAVVLGYSFFI